MSGETPSPTGCDTCDALPDPLATMSNDWYELHRSLHITGALIMLELLPVLRALLSITTHGRVPVDEAKVARWRRIVAQPLP